MVLWYMLTSCMISSWVLYSLRFFWWYMELVFSVSSLYSDSVMDASSLSGTVMISGSTWTLDGCLSTLTQHVRVVLRYCTSFFESVDCLYWYWKYLQCQYSLLVHPPWGISSQWMTRMFRNCLTWYLHHWQRKLHPDYFLLKRKRYPWYVCSCGYLCSFGGYSWRKPWSIHLHLHNHK